MMEQVWVETNLQHDTSDEDMDDVPPRIQQKKK